MEHMLSYLLCGLFVLCFVLSGLGEYYRDKKYKEEQKDGRWKGWAKGTHGQHRHAL